MRIRKHLGSHVAFNSVKGDYLLGPRVGHAQQPNICTRSYDLTYVAEQCIQ